MAKQKCGSCHYFEEAGLAGSGWCHHPQRKVSSDVMIMVRRNELACRDGWSRSLWEPAAGTKAANSQPILLETRRDQPLTSGSSKFGRGADDPDNVLPVDASGEDVLLSEARILAESVTVSQTPAPRATAGFDPRSAIFRAREAYRERARARAAAARQSAAPGALIDVPESETAGHLIARSEREHDDPPPGGGLDPDARSLPLEFDAIDRAELPQPVELPVPPTPAEKLQSAELRHIQRTSDDRDRGTDAGRTIEPATSSSVRSDVVLTPENLSPIREPVSREPVPGWFATELPRICRACRDYRPSAEGERGWCGNTWAFTTRRLVQANDVAPCQSAIGDWWLPVDDVWLVAADVSTHGRSTPLLDRFTSTERKQRRRS